MQIECPHCHNKGAVPEEFAGKTIKCKCGSKFVVAPLATSSSQQSIPVPVIVPPEKTFTCPGCGHRQIEAFLYCPICGYTHQQQKPATINENEGTTSAVYTLKGAHEILQVFKDRVIISGKKSTRTILYMSITALKFKQASTMSLGNIDFIIPGGSLELFRGTSTPWATSENAFLFSSSRNNAYAAKIKEYIESEMIKLRTPQMGSSAISVSDELQKLAKLKEQGILSNDEFQTLKKKLIG